MLFRNSCRAQGGRKLRDLSASASAPTQGVKLPRTGTVQHLLRCRRAPSRMMGTRHGRDHDGPRNHSEMGESKGGKPAAVDRTHRGGGVGIIRIMFPQAPQSEHDELVEITWDEFFEEFDTRELALVYDDRSMFNKIVGRDTAERRKRGEHGAPRH
jgi:hypothetical protein